MTRWILALLATSAAAATAGYWWARTPHQAYLVEPEATAAKTPHTKFAAREEPTRVFTAQQAEDQRAQQYRDLHTLDELRALPAEFSRREALYVIAGRADWSQLRELIASATALPNETERLDTLETLWLRYAELDPEAALRSALETDRVTATRLIATLARTQPEQAWEAVARIPDPMARLEYQNAVITAWAPLQPDRAFASVQAMPAAWQRGQLLREVTSQIAQRDPTHALELLKSVDPRDLPALRSVVADEWVRFDPTGAAQWVGAIEPGTQSELSYQIADAYLAQRQEEALAWALRIARSPGRNLWSHMVGQLALQDPEQAWQLAQNAGNPAQRVKASTEVIKTLAARNPALAMEYLRKLPEGSARYQVAQEVGNEVAWTVPAAAIAWLEGIEDSKLRIAVASNMAFNLARRDIEAATQLVDRVPKEARRQWIQAVTLVYAQSDPAKGADWLAKFRDVPGNVIASFGRNMAVLDPEVSLKVIDRFEGKQRQILLEGALPRIAQQAPETAARLVDDITDLHARTNVVGGVTEVWAQYDEPAARKWVLSMPWGDARDRGIAAVIGASAPSDDRVSLIGQIQSPGMRTQVIWGIARTDPETARTALRRYPLDPQQQAQIEATLRGRKDGGPDSMEEEGYLDESQN